MYSPLKLHFIVGIGRSGTTILIKLLNNHPQLHGMPEANFLAFFLHSYKHKQSFSRRDIDMLFEEIHLYSLSNPWIGWEFDADKTKQALIARAEAGPLGYAELCQLVYQGFSATGLDKMQATTLVDKNPSYTLFAGKIRRVFPGSRFIWIMRDYRANVLSRRQSVYMESGDVAYNAFRWNFFNKHMQRFARRHPGKVLLLRYEDLVTKPGSELKKICRFLGVEEDLDLTAPAVAYNVAHAQNSILPKYKDRFEKKYTDLNKALNADRLYAWKTGLTMEEIAACDAICGPFASRFGYMPAKAQSFQRRLSLRLRHLPAYLKALLSVRKELLIYYASPSLKLWRLRSLFKSMGLTKPGVPKA